MCFKQSLVPYLQSIEEPGAEACVSEALGEAAAAKLENNGVQTLLLDGKVFSVCDEPDDIGRGCEEADKFVGFEECHGLLLQARGPVLARDDGKLKMARPCSAVAGGLQEG